MFHQEIESISSDFVQSLCMVNDRVGVSQAAFEAVVKSYSFLFADELKQRIPSKQTNDISKAIDNAKKV